MKPQPLPSLSSVTERDPLDFNRTPAWCVELLIPHLGQPRTVLDVGCGDGAIGRVLRQAWPAARIIGIELERARRIESIKSFNHWLGETKMTYCGVYNRDWTSWERHSFDLDFPAGPDLIISNPPFGVTALRFLKRAIERVAHGGTVAFLLPTHWANDPDVENDYARQRFLDGLRLPDGRDGYCKLEIVGGGPYPARPSFKKGGTASDRYAWHMFGERWAGQPSRRIHAIPPAVASTQLELAVASEPEPSTRLYLESIGATWNPLTLEWEAP